MKISKPLSAQEMEAGQRVAEVSALVATGLLRLRNKSLKSGIKSKVCEKPLAKTGYQSVHASPYTE